MQRDPEKVYNNYNEYTSPPVGGYHIPFDPQNGELLTSEQQLIIDTGIRLVKNKIDEILGYNNNLTQNRVQPGVVFQTIPKKSVVGIYQASWNKITVSPDLPPQLQLHAYVHEHLHFMSHNGFDSLESQHTYPEMSIKNNVGLRRDFGIDIREGSAGQLTGDYFLSFNEAVTEELTREIFPDNDYPFYDDFRGLLYQVINDAVIQGIGSEQSVRQYIYQCYFKGDLTGFTELLQYIYRQYDISEQQFGLMTHRDDLPTIIEKKLTASSPDGSPPSPSLIKKAVQRRLNAKTEEDYITDLIGPGPQPIDGGSGGTLRHGQEYDDYIKEHAIVIAETRMIEGRERDIDSYGYIVYKGEESRYMLATIMNEVNELMEMLHKKEITKETAENRIDALLFEGYHMSMLSDGFRDFYVTKHSKIDQI